MGAPNTMVNVVAAVCTQTELAHVLHSKRTTGADIDSSLFAAALTRAGLRGHDQVVAAVDLEDVPAYGHGTLFARVIEGATRRTVLADP